MESLTGMPLCVPLYPRLAGVVGLVELTVKTFGITSLEKVSIAAMFSGELKCVADASCSLGMVGMLTLVPA